MLNHDQTSKPSDARRVLMAELERRCRQNPKYSLRSFARALELNPAMLSMVISGKRRLSRKMAAKIAQKLGLNPQASFKFIQSSVSDPVFASVNERYREISLDQFATISEWYHFAILSLIETKDFKLDFGWISSRLGISAIEARAAVDRLSRLKILDIKASPWRQVGGPIMIENSLSTSATRQFQTDVLRLARHSLENDSPDFRDISSVTMAIDPDHLPIAIEEIRKFKIYLMELLEKKGPAQEVYHLAVQFYPVSRRTK